MKHELPYFYIGSAYGGNQDWLTDRMMNLGGCAAVTACDSSIYFTRYKDAQGLYPYETEDVAKKDYIAFTNVMKPYLRPRWGGIDRLDMYIDGMGQFLTDPGDDDITMDPWSGDKAAAETKDVIKAQIDAGWPIPHLVLHHNNPNFKFYDWHWFLLTGYTEFDGDFMVKAVTYGSWRWLDFDGLWNTGHRKKGGLILYHRHS